MHLRFACLPLLAVALHAQTPHVLHATGPMDVSVKPESAANAAYGQVLLTKHYHGGLEADATGEMLTGGDLKAGTAGYVALETLTGSLDGRTGTFQLMHWGTMEGAKRDLRIIVVPGSGSGALHGLTGTLKIDIAPDGKHTYTFDYTLPGQ